jgi:type IV pilus assembly protein PilY1
MIQTSSSARPARDPMIKRVARALLPLLVTTTTLQPLAYAAPSDSQLSQKPNFVETAVDSNVLFLVDDSLSMEDIRLPIPSGLNVNEAAGGNVTVRGHATGWASGSGWTLSAPVTVSRRDEWILRSSALNPLFYNPAITYRPWNDNGRAGAGSSMFWQSPVGQTTSAGAPDYIVDGTTGFRFGTTPHDMRYAGPNFVSDGATANFGRRLTTAGANPPTVPLYLQATRPANGGFTATTDAVGRNPDIFSSPQQLVTGAAMCAVTPTSPTLTTLPATARIGIAQPSVPRTGTTRPSTPIAETARTDSPRSSDPRPATNRVTSGRPTTTLTTTAAAVTTRGSTALQTATRAITTRPSSAAPATTNRTTSTRPSTAVTATTNRTTSTRPSTSVAADVARTSSPITIEYRRETGVCGAGTWTVWSTTRTTGFCTDPTSEGSRAAAVEERRTCPAGFSPDGAAATATQCLSNCPAGSTASGSMCTYSCPAGTNRIGNQCYSACPTGSSIDGAATSSTQCISNCPANTTATATQCVGTCPAGTNLIGGQCYGACPGGSSINGAATSSTQCISNCPANTTASATQCVGGTCPAGTNLISGQCYSACPGGTTINGAATSSTQCIANCPAGTTTNGNICESCPGAFPNRAGSICYANCPGAVNPSNPAQCLSCASGTLNAATAQCTSCPAGSNLIGGTCYGACPGGTEFSGGTAATATQCITSCPTGTGLAQTATQCLGACPGGFPNLLNATATTCFAACPAGTSQVGTANATEFGTCRTNCPAGQTAVSAALCRGTCAAGTNQIGTSPVLCYGACPGGSTLNGAAATATQCLSNCPAGTTASGSVCLQGCPASHPTSIGTQCYQDCPATHPNPNPSNPAQCLAACPAGATQIGTQCSACPAGSLPFTGGTCCPSTALTVSGCPAVLPPGATCTAGQYMRDFARPAPAHYFVHLGGARDDPNNYARVDINRDRQSMSYPRAGTRTDCSNPGFCTWGEEAQNYANWYTYYRTRLFASIAVNAETLSGLTGDNNNLDRLRLAYGSINYVREAYDPFDPDFNPVTPPSASLISSTWSKRTLRDIDGQQNEGALVRGVRPFSERPLATYCTSLANAGTGSERCVARGEVRGDQRQEVFDWLFSLRATGSTPNREALDAAGLYYSRHDERGPWIEPDDRNRDPVWLSSERRADHLTCRRNYTILITDGEWTNNASGSQPLAPLATRNPSAVSLESPDSARSNALTTTGPARSYPRRTAYQYNPASEPQFSGGGSAGGTLADTALFWWRNDLRPDLDNNLLPPLPDPAKAPNVAYWQHMVPYIVGFGIEASMDTGTTRNAVISSATYPGSGTAVTWPAVNTDSLVITDRDIGPVDCRYNPATNPAGCGRVDDTMRAALAGRGDFLAATDVRRLAESTRAAFEVLNAQPGAQTTVTGRSASLRSGDRLFDARFTTVDWTGAVRSYDAVDYFNALEAGTTPASIDSRFPAPLSRNVATSTCKSGAACRRAFPRDATEVGALPAAQRAALANDFRMALWLRGDQAQEARSGGTYRNRPAGQIMGSIVNSQPIWSKFRDDGYGPGREPAPGAGLAYRTYVNSNRTSRPARIFVGSNGGMFHAFDVSGTPATNANYMSETFAYVPRAAYAGLTAFASPGYSHRYLVDGPIVEGDWWNGSQWRTVAIGTTGAGPKGIYAIDVTGGGAEVLWDIDVADAATAPAAENLRDIGHILQPGVIGRAPDGQWYYFVGNGYESLDDKAKLLAINVANGNVRVIDTDAVGDATVGGTNGLGGITPVYDGQRNIVNIYGGDRQGRLWKFNLNSWTSGRVFTAENAGTPQPISAAPRIVPHPRGGRMIVFGTGRMHERADINDTSLQTVYAVWEKEPTAASPTPVAKSALQRLTLANRSSSTGERFREISGTDGISWDAGGDLGWYLDLAVGSSSGERVVAAPVENFGFVNVTTFEPSENNNPCLGDGRSYFYSLDIAGTFTRAPFSNTGSVAGLPSSVDRSLIVGSELDQFTLNALQPIQRPQTGTPPPNSSTSLTSAQTAALAGRTASVSTNPCGAEQQISGAQGGKARPVSGPAQNCPIAPLRTWRDLPRGAR